jgi:hypothetical protein
MPVASPTDPSMTFRNGGLVEMFAAVTMRSHDIEW